MILTFIFCYHNYQPDLWYINASRILQLAELFKLQSYQRAVKVISNTILHTYKTFFFLYWFVMLLVVVFGAVMFALERGELTVNDEHPEGEYLRWNIERTYKEVSPFRSLAASMWYTLVSITTVGYGDIVPTTVAGRAIGSFLLLISFLIVALPITVIGEAFANAVDEYNNDKLKSRSMTTSRDQSVDCKTLHSLETMLRDSLSNEDNNDNQATSYNPMRRSLMRRPYNRASTRAMNNILQEIQTQQDHNLEEQAKQLEITDEWVDCLEQAEDTTHKELFELQFELFQNHRKMKEIEREYFQQMKSLNDIQTLLFGKIQKLMKTLNHENQTNGVVTPSNENSIDIKTEMVAFEIQS